MIAADVDDGDVSERLKCPLGTMESGVGITGKNDDIAVRLRRLECFEFIMQIAENEQLHVLFYYLRFSLLDYYYFGISRNQSKLWLFWYKILQLCRFLLFGLTVWGNSGTLCRCFLAEIICTQ